MTWLKESLGSPCRISFINARLPGLHFWGAIPTIIRHWLEGFAKDSTTHWFTKGWKNAATHKNRYLYYMYRYIIYMRIYINDPTPKKKSTVIEMKIGCLKIRDSKNSRKNGAKRWLSREPRARRSPSQWDLPLFVGSTFKKPQVHLSKLQVLPPSKNNCNYCWWRKSCTSW